MDKIGWAWQELVTCLLYIYIYIYIYIHIYIYIYIYKSNRVYLFFANVAIFKFKNEIFKICLYFGFLPIFCGLTLKLKV